MSDCECLAGCLFFNDKMVERPGFSAILKEKYCRGDNTECARYIFFKKLGKEQVPQDIFPNQQDRAKEIIATK